MPTITELHSTDAAHDLTAEQTRELIETYKATGTVPEHVEVIEHRFF